MKIGLILNNLRSVHNVGSIFRTGDGVGVVFIYLAGTTPAPIDRFGRTRDDFAKVALGAEDSIKWRYFSTIEEAIQEAREDGFRITALEQDANSVQVDEFKTDIDTALLLGEETKGLTVDELSLVDDIVEIPMWGKKESLNVGVAAGIALYFIKLNS